MKGTALALALALACLTLLLVAQGARGEGTTVRLCGRDFVRAVVFTCGGSRWRRHLAEHPDLLGSDADSSTYPDQGLGTDHQETHGVEPEVGRDLHGGSRSQREVARLLPTACCTLGCSRRDISSLC